MREVLGHAGRVKTDDVRRPVVSCTLLVAVLVSGIARRSILSTAVLFLFVGVVAGELGVLPTGVPSNLVAELAEFALFSVLFTDGMRAGLADLRGAWRLPGRLLLLGLPLTMIGNAVLAHLLAGLPWLESFLLGAVLSPTDPVFASAIVGREEVPGRVRHLLNVESGLNDGLALPVVLLLLAAAGGPGSRPLSVVGELAIGIVLGAAVPLAVSGIRRVQVFEASHRYEPLAAVAVALIVLASARVTKANEFLAAFASGSVLATVDPKLRREFGRFGELVTELLKLAALLVFGGLVTVSLLTRVGVGGWTFAVLALVAVRPAAVWLSLAGSGVRGRELVAVAWFGPKGFAVRRLRAHRRRLGHRCESTALRPRSSDGCTLDRRSFVDGRPRRPVVPACSRGAARGQARQAVDAIGLTATAPASRS